MRRLRYWLPVLIWALVISGASTRSFGSEHTSHYILPFLHWLFPNANLSTLEVFHHLIRKGGHVFEFAVFSLLLLYALRAGRIGWRWVWAFATLFVVACYAGLDEFHQSFVPGRGASVWDSLLDTSAGAAALIVAWGVSKYLEHRRARKNAVQA